LRALEQKTRYMALLAIRTETVSAPEYGMTRMRAKVKAGIIRAQPHHKRPTTSATGRWRLRPTQLRSDLDPWRRRSCGALPNWRSVRKIRQDAGSDIVPIGHPAGGGGPRLGISGLAARRSASVDQQRRPTSGASVDAGVKAVAGRQPDLAKMLRRFISKC